MKREVGLDSQSAGRRGHSARSEGAHGEAAERAVESSRLDASVSAFVRALASGTTHTRESARGMAARVAPWRTELQRSIGNRALAGMGRGRQGRARARPVLQRRLHPHKGETTVELHKVGGYVQDAVDDAVKTIASDPTLAAYASSDGYITNWTKTWKAFLGTPTLIPEFFYARYGYAVETIATKLLRAKSIAPYAFKFQVAHGHTRPDVVVVDRGNREVAWIDMTSEASRGHIFRKQGGGWKSRSYVAEACYDMPLPSTLAAGAAGLDDETRQRLEDATRHAAQQQAYLEIGRETIGSEIGAALEAARAEKGSGLSAADARKAMLAEAKARLGDKTTAAMTKSIVFLLDTIDVEGESAAGESWATWAFKRERVNSAQAKELLIAYGKGSEPEVEQSSEESISMDESSDM